VAINKRHTDIKNKSLITEKSLKTTFKNNELNIPPRGLTIINESGLYSLILRSKKPESKQFKRWVTSEVLSTIQNILKMWMI